MDELISITLGLAEVRVTTDDDSFKEKRGQTGSTRQQISNQLKIDFNFTPSLVDDFKVK
jgi:hypothetical protein